MLTQHNCQSNMVKPMFDWLLPSGWWALTQWLVLRIGLEGKELDHSLWLLVQARLVG